MSDKLIPAAREVLEPFATAVADADETTVSDDAEIWESPMAMCITHGDMRAVRDLLARLLARDVEALAKMLTLSPPPDSPSHGWE